MSLVTQPNLRLMVFLQAETMATRCGVDGAVFWRSDVSHGFQWQMETTPMEWYNPNYTRSIAYIKEVFVARGAANTLKYKTEPLRWSFLSISPVRQRSSCRQGRFQPDPQLWPSAPGGSRRATSGHGAQRRVGEEVRPPHWPVAPRHGETHRVQDLPAG